MKKKRCQWVTDDPIYIDYHDHEWGRPVYDDRRFFEMLTLEGAQAGLSWITILKRRENYWEAFDQFDFHKIASYDENRIQELLKNDGIIRHERKIRSVVKNARHFIEIRNGYGSFSEYIWSFVDGQPIINYWKESKDVPQSTPLSEKISKDLKKRGFTFVGPVIIYSFLQATGIINDHEVGCFCHPNNQKNNK